MLDNADIGHGIYWTWLFFVVERARILDHSRPLINHLYRGYEPNLSR
jgi:hypothetical protein